MEEDAILLRGVQSEIFHRLLPLIVILIILGIMGFCGNLLAIIFYFTKTKRTSAIALIACLAIADLVVCVLFIPNIIEMSVNVMYTESFPCKLAHFVGLWTVANSGLILAVIAIDRHRKICRPFGKHYELHYVKFTVIGIVVFGFLLSVRNFVTFDTTPVSVRMSDANRTVTGHYCTTRDDENYKVPVTIFVVIDFLLMIAVWITLIVTYSHIIYTLYKLIKAQDMLDETTPTRTNNVPSSSDSQDATDGNHLSYISVKEDTDGRPIAAFTAKSNFSSIDNDEYSSTCESGTMDLRRKKHHKHNTAMCAVERNLTFMMLVVSIVFFVCFTPYFVVKILMRSVLHTGEEYELGLDVQFALRLPYMNSVFNPIIYCYFNPHFREYIKSTFLSCFRRKHNTTSNE